MINDMKGKTYEDRLRCLELWTLEERRNRQDLIEVFKMFRGFSSILLHNLFILDKNSKGTRGHTGKLVKTRCTRDITKYFIQARSLVESAGPTDGGCTQYQYIQVEIVLYQGQPDGLFHGLVR